MADAANKARWLSRDSGPLLALRVSISQNPWRIGPAWAVLAGACASGAAIQTGTDLLRWVGAVILADSAWGAVWALMAGGSDDGRGAGGWYLPYAQEAAPIVWLSERVRSLTAGAGCRELVAGSALALGLAALLGPVALGLTALVILIAIGAQMVAERGHRPAFGYALLSLGLPWSLGLALSGHPFGLLSASVVIGAAFTVLQWGIQAGRGGIDAATTAVWVGELAVLGALAWLRLPWAACLASVLFLPPSWWLLRARTRPGGVGCSEAARLVDAAASRGAVWWWVALVLAALAVRQLAVI